jgi:hypothetical protein
MFYGERRVVASLRTRSVHAILWRGALLLALAVGAWFACSDDETTGPGGAGGAAYLGPSSFEDVSREYWAHDEIETLFQEGYVSGCHTSPRRYCPEDGMTRAEAAVFVVRGVRGAHFEPRQPTEQVFEDVPLSAWYADWVTQLYDDGYTDGCAYDSNTDRRWYCPLDEVTHAEASVFFLRMLNGTDYEPPAATGLFSNVPVTSWAAKWLEKAFLQGLIPPHLVPDDFTPAGLTFDGPFEPATRGEAAYMMYRAKEPADYNPLGGPDLPITFWTRDELDNKRDIVQLAATVQDWLLRFRGDRWWNGVFPHEKQLAAWLLFEEAGGCYPNENGVYGCCFPDADMGHMVRYTRYDFRDGMSDSALANFTSFFNPNSGRSFDSADWEELVGPILNGSVMDLSYHLQLVEDVYSETYRRPDYFWWWDYCETREQYRRDRSWITDAVHETQNYCTGKPFYFTSDYSIRAMVIQDLEPNCQ